MTAQMVEKFPASYGIQRFITVRFQVLTAAHTKMRAYRDTAPCILVEVDRRFKGAYCRCNQDDEDSGP
jgi:hypothetical protein